MEVIERGARMLHPATYLVAKKELRDRNWKRQELKKALNIPKGTKFYMLPHQAPKFKFVTLYYRGNRYEVKTSDLDIVEGEYYGYKDGENRVW